MYRMSGGVEILRHRTGHGLGLGSTFPSKEDKKMRFGGSLSATKRYAYKARPRKLSAISPTRNVTYMVYTHTPESVFPESIFIIKSG